MPGASPRTRRVKVLNANWTPAAERGGGTFELMLITDDDQRHTTAASPAEVTALTALAQADTVMAWDPENRTLIIANIVGTMPWTSER